MRDYRKLQIWNIGREVAKEVYIITKGFPKDELYGITSQMRRAAVSIPSNIAEGCGRDSVKEFVQFLRISLGSVRELETQFYISSDIEYVDEMKFDLVMKKLDEASKKIWAYIKYLEERK
ncbi:four helix bundle protein [Candidatus Pacearchaeota archaeon]|nr:four helix bundle protein [Candidatus Pacearchaeota archaeon]